MALAPCRLSASSRARMQHSNCPVIPDKRPCCIYSAWRWARRGLLENGLTRFGTDVSIKIDLLKPFLFMFVLPCQVRAFFETLKYCQPFGPYKI